MNLPDLFHWSPTSRHENIARDGLKPFSDVVTHSDDGLRAPYICLSPNPRDAWHLSGDMEWTSEHDQWDLWLVTLPEMAETHFRPVFGVRISEVRVYSAIPAANVWHVAMREPAVFVAKVPA